MKTLIFYDEPLFEIVRALEKRLQSHGDVVIEVCHPDLQRGLYAGSLIYDDDRRCRHRSWRNWNDLAQQLGCRLLLPKEVGPTRVQIRFEKLHNSSFHAQNTLDKAEKYGVLSEFAQIRKNEESAFLLPLMQALKLCALTTRRRLLNLGVNRGDELHLIESLMEAKDFKALECIGIDHSHSAIAQARESFNAAHCHFYAADINQLKALNLGSFDLIMSIGTLQSPGIAYKPFLMELVQEHLSSNAALLLGFPNSRWIDGELIYGAKMKNYRESELSLVLSDIDFAKRYLQQKKFQVRIFGREYLFLVATK